MITTIKNWKIYENNNSIDIIEYTANEFTKYAFNPKNPFTRKFIKKMEGGLNSFEYYQYEDYRFEPHDVRFFILFANNIPCAMAHIRKSPYRENTYWLSYLSVDKNHEGKGYASQLAEYIFKWFRDNDITLETSSYTEDGFVKLKPLFNKLAKKYNIEFIDKGKL